MTATSCASSGRGRHAANADLEPPAARAASELAAGAWVPSASASFAHLGEHTTYAVVHAEDEDLLAIDQPLFDPIDTDRQIGQATWLIPISMYAGLGAPIDFVADEPKAYVLEALEGEPTRAIPAVGRVTIHTREGDEVDATISLSSLAPPPTAGGPRPSRLVLGARLSLARTTVYTPQPERPSKRE